ncbi:MAG: helix-turn-helix domain-containing protein [Burkholderiaceae bacterium]|nr:helix-turn-helix domain-containing protein [Burkholderiaceae bacterium]MDZ4145862.1 helix-turn-helix domain-containing protein [Burkholderiales bacterium]
MKPALLPSAEQRLHQIALARQAVLHEGRSLTDPHTDGAEGAWIERSWRRCLAYGHRPEHRLAFDRIPPRAPLQHQDANRHLVSAARPVLEKLGRAIANTRYFAILTDADGIVIDVDGPIDRTDRRAHLITRIGVDLSERSVGTTAIGAALTELAPVWLHRGEHFFADTGVYSCAGAPLFGPDGRCVGMLDLTGIEAVERPELKHLVTQSARSIENALTLTRPHSLLVRLNWPGRTLGDDADGLVCLDADGWVTAANPTAREMVSQLGARHEAAVHASDLFAMPFEMLFDAVGRHAPRAEPMEVPLWSGLRLHALPMVPGAAPGALPARRQTAPADTLPLKDLETALIRKAVDDARGNVTQAARALGISRATVYRKISSKKTV